MRERLPPFGKTEKKARTLREAKNLTRREVSEILGAAMAAGAVLGVTGKMVDAELRQNAGLRRKHPLGHPHHHEMPHKEESKHEPIEAEPFKTWNMATRSVSHEGALYLGIKDIKKSTQLGEEITVNFEDAQEHLWDLKEAAAAGSDEMNQIKEIRKKIQDKYHESWHQPATTEEEGKKRSRDLERTNMLEVRQQLAKRMLPFINVFGNRDFMARALRDTYNHHLTDEAINVTADLIAGITPEMLLAYSMTELMPTDFGEYNATFYDFLLRTAGARYLAGIPNLSDKRAEFGAMQIMNEGWGTGSNGKKSGGLVMNDLLPNTVKLEARTINDLTEYMDQLLAGYLFAANNIASVISYRLSKDEIREFGELARGENNRTLLAFLSACHHRPRSAWDALVAFLGKEKSHPGQSSYRDCCDAYVNDYCEKTEINYKAASWYLSDLAMTGG